LDAAQHAFHKHLELLIFMSFFFTLLFLFWRAAV
jgi:hypothetical protein